MMRAMPQLVVLLALMLLPAAFAAAEPPLHVTTDSRAYCEVLLERLAQAPGAAQGNTARLTRQGRELCHSGHPRTGIAKLRRALRLALAEAE